MAETGNFPNQVLYVNRKIGETFPNHEVVINKDGAFVIIVRNWLPNEWATEFMNFLVKNIQWERHTHSMGVEQRLTYPMGDPGVKHGYTQRKRDCKPWLEQVEFFKNSFNTLFNTKINGALFNLYEKGQDYISYHSDSEVLPPLDMVIAISLGQSRDFYFKEKGTGEVTKTVINNGDLMLMYGQTQNKYLHSVPKRTGANASAMGPRLSITFRELIV